MLTRRSFLASTLAAGAVSPSGAQSPVPPSTVLRLERRTIEVNGKPASVFGISGPGGALGLNSETGTQFRVRLENHIDSPSLVHWHGLTPPWRQDGVAGVSAPPVPPGGHADYDFPLAFGGTYWMHSHYQLQEQLLMTAPLIIRDRGGGQGEQEAVVLLNDFSFTPPGQIFAQLRKRSPAATHAGRAGHMRMPPETAMPDMKPDGSNGMAGSAMAKPPGGAGPDLNDVKYDAFLANNRTLADPEAVKVEAGGRILLRIINGSSMSNYHIDLGQLEGELIAVDGHPAVPVRGRLFPAAVAQRLDIRLTLPPGPGAYPILAVLEGERKQTGVILVAGGGAVSRLPELAEAPSLPLSLDLESRLRATEPLTPRPVDRTHILNLTGDMQTYQWSINNVSWTESTPPLEIKEGERVELVFVNKTPMPHPMHLHGHVYQVTAIDGRQFPGAMRDTVLVPPKTSVTVAFDANNPGLWALHCHLLYHLEAGMFTTLRYM
ncbi:MAG: multicopper oxidase family protein [Beijerinckiaceae bacterium]|nr:multicopper oxidase family protein [Beijerinckiaceae bacterium]